MEKWKILEVKCVLTSIFLLWNLFFFILVKITPLLQCIKWGVVEDLMHQKKDLLSSIFFLFCFWEQTNNCDRKVYVDIEEHESSSVCAQNWGWYEIATFLTYGTTKIDFEILTFVKKERKKDRSLWPGFKSIHCVLPLTEYWIFTRKKIDTNMNTNRV